MQDYWHRQAADKPLFPDLAWSRPENRAHAGKLLIVGGNQHGFASPAEAFGAAEAAGIGVARVLLPDALQRMVAKLFPAAEYAASTPSGGFGQKALIELLDGAAWADGVLLAGDFGRNSETAILFEKFVAKYSGLLSATNDAADYFISTPETILQRPNTLLVLDFAQTQKLLINSHFPRALTSTMDLIHVVDILHEYSSSHPIHLIMEHEGVITAAVGGQVSTTHAAKAPNQTQLASHAAVWWLQNANKPLEALTVAIQEVAS